MPVCRLKGRIISHTGSMARSALSELSDGECVGLMVDELSEVRDVELIAVVRNKMADPLRHLLRHL